MHNFELNPIHIVYKPLTKITKNHNQNIEKKLKSSMIFVYVFVWTAETKVKPDSNYPYYWHTRHTWLHLANYIQTNSNAYTSKKVKWKYYLH